MSGIIDAHQHFWRLERGDYSWMTPAVSPIRRDFMPGDLMPLLRQHGVVGTVLVQAAPTEAETRFLLDIAEANGFVRGVVGWVDMEAPDAPQRIAALAAHPKLVGLRPMVQDIDDDNWLLRRSLTPAFEAVIAHRLALDALVLPRHLPHLVTLRERHPELRIVVDHAGKPAIRDRRFDDWAGGIGEVGADGESYCKLSGLLTEAGPDWDADELGPWLDYLLACFGADRLIFGSDWPVLTLAGSYGDWLAVVQGFLAALPEPDRRLVLRDNAVRAYRLSP